MPVSKGVLRKMAALENALHCPLSSTTGGRMRSDIPLGRRRRFGLLMMEEDPFKKN
jgi:hypothetical protein